MKKVLFAIALIAGFSVAHAADEKMSREQISKAIKPVGQVHIGGGADENAAPAGPRSGEEVYNASCNMCHGAGVSGAPKPGDGAEWAKRLEKGIEAVYANAIKGFGAMPPRGTCASCSDDEIKAAIDFMSK